jgi:hypothetical protein
MEFEIRASNGAVGGRFWVACLRFVDLCIVFTVFDPLNCVKVGCKSLEGMLFVFYSSAASLWAITVH